MSELPLHLFNAEDLKKIFLTQAKNYFFLDELSLSNSFFELVKTDSFTSSKESDFIKTQAIYYQILIAIFQGNTHGYFYKIRKRFLEPDKF